MRSRAWEMVYAQVTRRNFLHLFAAADASETSRPDEAAHGDRNAAAGSEDDTSSRASLPASAETARSDEGD